MHNVCFYRENREAGFGHPGHQKICDLEVDPSLHNVKVSFCPWSRNSFDADVQLEKKCTFYTLYILCSSKLEVETLFPLEAKDYYCKTFPFPRVQGWRNGSVVKRAYCFCKGLKFNAQHPSWAAHNHRVKLQLQGIQQPFSTLEPPILNMYIASQTYMYTYNYKVLQINLNETIISHHLTDPRDSLLTERCKVLMITKPIPVSW